MQDVNTPDEFDTFGFTIAKKLRLLNSLDKKEASTCELEIHRIIHEFELKLLE